uniref:Protein kinase domain-containing protein n=1 Tax=Globisporangium ultimum (strain ATCC 200006 / CBS 805.95 / DAOM BR144) TaxID=431595 RepID=K3X294_GLOUD
MTLSIFVLLEYAIKLVLCVGLIVYTRHNRHEALRGDSGAARKVLLPAFEPLLWIISAIAGSLTAYMVYMVAGKTYLTLSPSVVNEVLYSGRHFSLLLVVVFMLQKSVSLLALARAAMISLFMSAYTVPLTWVLLAYGDSSTVDRSFWVISFAHAPVLIPFMYAAIYPPSRATKRIQRQYCAYYFVAFILECFSHFTLKSHALDIRLGFIYAGLVWGSLSPLVIWRVLKADTAHWRGFGQRACQLQPTFSGSTISLQHSHGPRATGSRPTVAGTVDHMAPEIIMGVGRLADYDSAADIYALGITMWEILYPGEEKYPEAHSNTFLIFDTVVSGCRPHLNPRLHPKLQELLTSCWHPDPAQRPSAQQVVYMLEQIQEEAAAIFALELIDELQEEMMLDKLADEFVLSDGLAKTFGLGTSS